MYSLSLNFLKFAAAGAFVALTAANSTPVSADEMVQNLRSVGPRQFMINTVGSKRVTAFYVTSNGTCNVHAVILNDDDAEAATGVRVRLSLNPAQAVSIHSAENKSLTLECGDYADALSV